MQNRAFNLNRRHVVVGGAMVAAGAAFPTQEVFAAGTTGTPFLVRQNELEWFDVVPGEKMAIHVPNGRVGGRFSVVESIAAPGAGTPPHIHRSADEYFFMQEGSLHFACDGVEFDASAGMSVVIPRGAAHSWVNLTDEPARMQVLFTPGGVEEMFSRLAAAFPAGVEALAAQYDTVLVR